MKSNNYSNKIEVAANQNIKEKTYWLEKLAGDLEKSCFPGDYNLDHPKKNDDYCKASVQLNITNPLAATLLALCKGDDKLLHVVLMAATVALLGKYTAHRDIVIGTPVYKQESGKDFVNTALALRSTLPEEITFKQLLVQVRTTLLEALEHQNYPLEVLPRQLGMGRDFDSFPLFDVSVVLKNIHDKKYLEHIRHSMTFVFLRAGIPFSWKSFTPHLCIGKLR